MNEGVVEALSSKLPGDAIRSDEASLRAYGCDWTRGHDVNASLVLLPRSSEEVASCLRACNELGVGVVPSGGRTGLAAGAVATKGEVVLSLERMNKIEKIDVVDCSAQVQAGVTTQALQEAAEAAGLFFGLDLAAKGSSQIGGNIGTNAGGTKLIRYGGMREQVLGIEVVLADGTIVDMNTSLRKNNSGYDLKQLFVGAEGTLGVVTRATLRLVPKPKELNLVCIGAREFASIPEVFSCVQRNGLTLSAFEFFADNALELVLRHNDQLRAPTQERYPYYALVELEGASDAEVEALVEELFEKQLIPDGVIAASAQEFRDLWSLRENISESLSQQANLSKNDISVRVGQLGEFVDAIGVLLEQAPADLELVLFGHIGDGNLHVNYISRENMSREAFQASVRSFETAMFSRLADFGGSISAEHGIGLLKKADLGTTRSEIEILLMKQIKRVLDPKGIMNPGKIFDL